MVKGEDIENLMIDFAVRAIRLCESLEAKPVEQHIRNQLLRSGTAPAPNYAEARGAESGRDFVHKLRIVLKELNESRVWMKILMQADLVPASRLTPFLDECEQLCRIIGSSIQTAVGRSSN